MFDERMLPRFLAEHPACRLVVESSAAGTSGRVEEDGAVIAEAKVRSLDLLPCALAADFRKRLGTTEAARRSATQAAAVTGGIAGIARPERDKVEQSRFPRSPIDTDDDAVDDLGVLGRMGQRTGPGQDDGEGEEPPRSAGPATGSRSACGT